jgi:hypothetical protein
MFYFISQFWSSALEDSSEDSGSNTDDTDTDDPELSASEPLVEFPEPEQDDFAAEKNNNNVEDDTVDSETHFELPHTLQELQKNLLRCHAQMWFAPGFSDPDKYRWDSRLFDEGWCLSSNAWCANLLPK